MTTNEEGSCISFATMFVAATMVLGFAQGGSGGKAGSGKGSGTGRQSCSRRGADDKAKAPDKTQPKKDAKKADKKKTYKKKAEKRRLPRRRLLRLLRLKREGPREEVSYPILHLMTGLPEGHRKIDAPRVS